MVQPQSMQVRQPRRHVGGEGEQPVSPGELHGARVEQRGERSRGELGEETHLAIRLVGDHREHAQQAMVLELAQLGRLQQHGLERVRRCRQHHRVQHEAPSQRLDRRHSRFARRQHRQRRRGEASGVGLRTSAVALDPGGPLSVMQFQRTRGTGACTGGTLASVSSVAGRLEVLIEKRIEDRGAGRQPGGKTHLAMRSERRRWRLGPMLDWGSGPSLSGPACGKRRFTDASRCTRSCSSTCCQKCSSWPACSPCSWTIAVSR
eukprot:scaffold32676_cov61-Phaeocystis_antarctica.AAC.4